KHSPMPSVSNATVKYATMSHISTPGRKTTQFPTTRTSTATAMHTQTHRHELIRHAWYACGSSCPPPGSMNVVHPGVVSAALTTITGHATIHSTYSSALRCRLWLPAFAAAGAASPCDELF